MKLSNHGARPCCKGLCPVCQWWLPACSSYGCRADNVTTQMAAAIFKQEEQVLKDIAVYVKAASHSEKL